MTKKAEFLLPLRINPLDLLPEEELEHDNYDPTAKVPEWMRRACERADAELAARAARKLP